MQDMALPWEMRIDELKNIANEVTYTNEEDGIGHYLTD